MIIESSFFRLPEILLTNRLGCNDTQHTHEGGIVTALASSLLIELSGRNIPNPFEHIHTEYPYDLHKRWRADLFVNLNGASQIDQVTQPYGIREENWIEVKKFHSPDRTSDDSIRKQRAAGKIVRDLLRLCLLPEEHQGTIRKNGRYLVVTTLNHPEFSLNLSQNWLASLFRPGCNDFKINLSVEKQEVLRSVGNRYPSNLNATINLLTVTSYFFPTSATVINPLYGYLFRIIDFSVEVDGEIFELKSNGILSSNDKEKAKEVRQYFITRVLS